MFYRVYKGVVVYRRPVDYCNIHAKIISIHTKDLHDCWLFDEYPRINRHPYLAGEHPQMSQYPWHLGVVQMAGMALDVTGTYHRYLCNWNTLLSHHLALSWILLVSSNGSLSHFTSALGPRAQLLTLTCPQTILLAHKLRSTSCHDNFSFSFHPFFSRLEALECPGIWLQNDPLLGKIGHIVAELWRDHCFDKGWRAYSSYLGFRWVLPYMPGTVWKLYFDTFWTPLSVPYPLPSHGAALLSLPSLSDLAIILFGPYLCRFLTVSLDCWSIWKPSSMPFRWLQHVPVPFLLALSVSP